MTGLDDLREWLIGNGFKTAINSLGPRDNVCDWYAYRRSAIPARACECNAGKAMQIVVKPYSHGDRPEWKSCEVDVTGEAGGVWYKLCSYSIKPDDLRERLPAIEAALIAAWNALHA